MIATACLTQVLAKPLSAAVELLSELASASECNRELELATAGGCS